ncbi:MAG: hypothetical protein WD872_01375, partial [Pirellulaceae bacterium]
GERLARLESLASLSLVDLGEPGASNLAVARLETSQPLVTTRAQVTLQAEIQSFSRQDLPRQAVEFLVDGQRISDQRVDLPAGGRVSVSATHRFDTAGEHVVEVRLADDALPLDNRRWLSVPVREAVRVLAVGGRPGETRHVALALNPNPQQPGGIQVTEAIEGSLIESDLAAFDCVVLCNLARFSRDEAGVLRAYFQRGGGLIVFLGDQVQAESYNRQLAASDPAERILPATLGEVVNEAQYRLNPLEYRHPVVAPFRGHEASGLVTTPIWKYIKLTPFAESEVALAFDNGDPLLVESRIGRGRSILFATAASPDSLDRSTTPPTPWTALSSWPSFPPLVQEMLNLAVSGRGAARNVEVGDDLTGTIPGATLDAQIALALPDGASQRLPIVHDGQEARWSYTDVAHSGVYEARAGELVQKFAVNLNARESDLARFDPELLPSQFNREADAGAPAVTQRAASEGESYFRLLLSLVVLLLLVDPCLAWYFGRGRG